MCENKKEKQIKQIKIRSKHHGIIQVKFPTRGKAIKLFCTECLGWEIHPKECTDNLCPLFNYRGVSLWAKKGQKRGSCDAPSEK